MYQWNTSQSSLSTLLENANTVNIGHTTQVKEKTFEMEVTNINGTLVVTHFKMYLADETIQDEGKLLYLISDGKVLVATNLTFTQIQNNYRFEPEEFFDWVRKVPYYVNLAGLKKIILWEVI